MVPRTEIASPDSHATGYAYFVDTLANTYPEKYLVVVVRTPAQTQTHTRDKNVLTPTIEVLLDLDARGLPR